MAAKHWLLTLAASVMLMIGMAGAPAVAHRDHPKKPAAERPVATAERAGPAMAVVAPPAGTSDERPVDRSRMSTMERLLDWLGRLHPIIVHFPIAFFPAALLAAILGRKRPAFAAPMRFLVIAGGTVAPIAALLGWLDAGFNPATDDWLLQTHRWLGTGIGIGGAALAWWSLKKPAANSGRWMIALLTAVTVAIAVQGWLGGALVHGADHLNW